MKRLTCSFIGKLVKDPCQIIKRNLGDWGISEQAVTVTLSDSHQAWKGDTNHWLGLTNYKRERGGVEDMEFPGVLKKQQVDFPGFDVKQRGISRGD